MPFVQAKCENCNGILEVDSTKKAAICPYCGTPYVVQDAINNYITNIETLHADVVNINDDKSARARLDAAEAFMKLHKYREAWKAFSDVCSLTPQDFRGWWGKIRVYTEDFTLQIENESILDEVSKLYQSVLVVVPEEIKGEIEHQFLGYIQLVEERNTQRKEKLKQREEKLKQSIRLLQSEHTQLQSTIAELERKEFPQGGCMSGGVAGICLVAIAVCAVLSFVFNEALVLIPMLGVLFAISLIWEIFIRPVRNLISRSKARKNEAELKNKREQRDMVQEKLRHIQQELDEISKQMK